MVRERRVKGTIYRQLPMWSESRRARPIPPAAPPDTRPRPRRTTVLGAVRAPARAPAAPAPGRATGARGARGPPGDTSRPPAAALAYAAAPGRPGGPPWTGHSTADLRARAPAGHRPSARRAPGRVRGACGPESPQPPGAGAARAP